MKLTGNRAEALKAILKIGGPCTSFVVELLNEQERSEAYWSFLLSVLDRHPEEEVPEGEAFDPLRSIVSIRRRRQP